MCEGSGFVTNCHDCPDASALLQQTAKIKTSWSFGLIMSFLLEVFFCCCAGELRGEIAASACGFWKPFEWKAIGPSSPVDDAELTKRPELYSRVAGLAQLEAPLRTGSRSGQTAKLAGPLQGV
jgi:hypothetical protein